MATEKRLIDANRLKMRMNAFATAIKREYLSIEAIVDTINTEYTVDAVEVVHGRWKYYHKQNIAVCTNCSFERDLDANFGRAVSCPNCGAKIDGERTGNEVHSPNTLNL